MLIDEYFLGPHLSTTFTYSALRWNNTLFLFLRVQFMRHSFYKFLHHLSRSCTMRPMKCPHVWKVSVLHLPLLRKLTLFFPPFLHDHTMLQCLYLLFCKFKRMIFNVLYRAFHVKKKALFLWALSLNILAPCFQFLPYIKKLNQHVLCLRTVSGI